MKAYPPLEGRFRKRAVWAGDIMSRDASIIVREVKFTYNGTFSCQIKNPPDVHGNAGEIRFRVVHTGLSEGVSGGPWVPRSVQAVDLISAGTSLAESSIQLQPRRRGLYI